MSRALDPAQVENPKRPGSQSFQRFEPYKEGGCTVGDVLGSYVVGASPKRVKPTSALPRSSTMTKKMCGGFAAPAAATATTASAAAAKGSMPEDCADTISQVFQPKTPKIRGILCKTRRKAGQ